MSDAQTKKEHLADILTKEGRNFSIRPYDSNSICILPVVPIFPVRYGLSAEYLKKTRGTKEIPPEITALSEPKGMMPSNDYQLMELRQGYIYIYAATKHKLFSTDERGYWMVFRYATNKWDNNSGREFDKPDGKVIFSGIQNKFLLYKWNDAEKGANGVWDKADITQDDCPRIKHICVFDTPWVDNQTSEVEIAYSEYPWSQEMFEQLEKDAALRQRLMTKVRPLERAVTQSSAPLHQISTYVTEYKKDAPQDLLQATQKWNTKLVNRDKLPAEAFMPNYEEAGLVVALQDVEGIMQELNKLISDLADKRDKYNAEYAYPLTIGNIIDPKIQYDIKGVEFPYDNDVRVITQIDANEVLHPQFKEVYSNLVRTPFLHYEKPAEKLCQTIIKLCQFDSFKAYLSLCSNALSNKNITTKGLDRTSYCFFMAMTCALEQAGNTQLGHQLLTAILDGKVKQQDDTPFDFIRDNIANVLQILATSIIVSVSLEKRYVIAKLFYYSLNQFLATGLNIFGQVGAVYKGPTLKNIFKLLAFVNILNASAVREQLLNDAKKRLIENMRQGLRQNRQEEMKFNSSLKVFSRKQNAQHLAKFRAQLTISSEQVEASIKQNAEQLDYFINKRYSGAVNLLVIFCGISTLKQNLALKQKRATSWSGYWASDPHILSAAIIMDLSVATIELGHRVGIIQNLKGIEHYNGSYWRALRKSPFGTINALLGKLGSFLNILISGALFNESRENEDDWGMLGNGIAFLGGLTILNSSLIATAIGITVASGWVILAGIAIILIGTIIAMVCGRSDLGTWVKLGFWGNSNNYKYWEKSRRRNLQVQINDTKILGKQFNGTEFTNRLLIGANILLSDNGKITDVNQLSKDIHDYFLMKRRLEDEVYGYFILFDLSIIPPNEKKTYFTIYFGEFLHTTPTENNLTITCYYPDGNTIKITKWYQLTSLVEVGFSLEANGITRTDFKLDVEFTDNQGNVFTTEYSKPEYWSGLVPQIGL